MNTPAPPSRSLSDLRELTPARVGLGRAGVSMPTEALLAHHLILFARAASVGQQNASNYSIRLREASVPAE